MSQVRADKVISAEELEAMTPDERHRVLNESIVTDLTEIPAETLERFRARGRQLLEERAATKPTSG